MSLDRVIYNFMEETEIPKVRWTLRFSRGYLVNSLLIHGLTLDDYYLRYPSLSTNT